MKLNEVKIIVPTHDPRYTIGMEVAEGIARFLGPETRIHIAPGGHITFESKRSKENMISILEDRGYKIEQ